MTVRWRTSRGSPFIFSAGVLACSLFISARGHGDESMDEFNLRHRSFESPQHFAFEFRLSPYKPQIDDDPALGGRTPYRDTFGTMPRLLVAAEFDWQVLHIPHFGRLGPGFSVGYTSMADHAMKADGSGPSAEETSLDIFPLYAVAVLRVDVFMRDANIPLVPYVKAGVGYALWRASNSAGTSTATDAGGNEVSGKGHTWGTQLALGLAFQLNALDRKSAREFDENVGVNNTYLFAEYMRADLNGFGQSSALRVGAETWAAGLAFEF